MENRSKFRLVVQCLVQCLRQLAGAALVSMLAATAHADAQQGGPGAGANEVQAQHGVIGVLEQSAQQRVPHPEHADAQWFPKAGFGLFLHWGLSSVFDGEGRRIGDLSWPMMAGAWKNKTFTDPQVQQRIIREQDWNFDGKAPLITPNQYWAAAQRFNPQRYDADKWIAAAKAAGFSYVVLTTRHHEGFALWPSAYGDFNTSNYMQGRDLLRPFIEACRKYGLKVGLYYSPPDWHFDREFQNFMYYGTAALNPWLPQLDADLQPRLQVKSEQERAQHLIRYNAMIKGQVEELLTRYGKIDLLWFDGAVPAPEGDAPRLTEQRVRELQPGIVLSPRYFHKGDFVSFEGATLKTDQVMRNSWAEWCSTWTKGWAYNDAPFHANGFELGHLALARSLNMNFLLGIGPDAQGELHPQAYRNMQVVGRWMQQHGAAVRAGALPPQEHASVPATAQDKRRYLFALPQYAKSAAALDADQLPLRDAELVLEGLAAAPRRVVLMGDGHALSHQFRAGKLTVLVPAARRSNLPDVVALELP